MGKASNRRLIVTIIFVSLALLVINVQTSPKKVSTQVPLIGALKQIGNWKGMGMIPLDEKIIKTLKLDDYVNQNYAQGDGYINLYIGYYNTSKKVGAAHNPLVCFPGQGWLLTNKSTGELSMDMDPVRTVFYTLMIAEQGIEKELVLYWFQSYDQTSPDTFRQKLQLLWKKINVEGEDNAFVRITVQLDGKTISESENIILTFVKDFYPIFLNHVTQNGEA